MKEVVFLFFFSPYFSPTTSVQLLEWYEELFGGGVMDVALWYIVQLLGDCTSLLTRNSDDLGIFFYIINANL
jgi:hypothetical protein